MFTGSGKSTLPPPPPFAMVIRYIKQVVEPEEVLLGHGVEQYLLRFYTLISSNKKYPFYAGIKVYDLV